MFSHRGSASQRIFAAKTRIARFLHRIASPFPCLARITAHIASLPASRDMGHSGHENNQNRRSNHDPSSATPKSAVESFAVPIHIARICPLVLMLSLLRSLIRIMGRRRPMNKTHIKELGGRYASEVSLDYIQQMDAEDLGRKLLLTPSGDPPKLPEKQTVGTVTVVAHDCGHPLSRYTCRATHVAADFLNFISSCRCSSGVAPHPLKILVSHLSPPHFREVSHRNLGLKRCRATRGSRRYSCGCRATLCN